MNAANDLVSVREAARACRRNPETIRRWIRSGKLRARKIDTQHVIDEHDLQPLVEKDMLPLPRQGPAPGRSWAHSMASEQRHGDGQAGKRHLKAVRAGQRVSDCVMKHLRLGPYAAD